MEKEEAKILYGNIGRIWCPALNDVVAFNHAGFRHLLRKRGLLRSPHEQSKRLALIPYAKKIIEGSDSVAEYRVENSNRVIHTRGKKRIEIAQVKFWSLKAESNGQTITVVVRQSSNGTKHFLSVF